MKRTFFAAAALATSSAVHAGPTTGAGIVVDLEYWGLITEGPSGSVGDPVYGLIRIDTRIAPADSSYIYPEWVGEYTVNDECPRNCAPEATEPSRFVTSAGIRDLGGAVFDRVLVVDHDLDPSGEWTHDRYSVRDYEFRPEGPDYGWSHLSVNVSSTVDFITGESLVQSFDLRPAESGGAAGQSHSFLDGVASGFAFVIDRIRATPRVCKP